MEVREVLATIISMFLCVRTETMKVTYTNVMTAEVFVVDSDGEEWAFYGDNFRVGDEIKVVMYNGNEIVGVVE